MFLTVARDLCINQDRQIGMRDQLLPLSYGSSFFQSSAFAPMLFLQQGWTLA